MPDDTKALCLRQTPRQATSAVAYVAPPPEDDDPLLAFAPYIHAQPRSNAITPGRQRRFIATLAATGIVTQAAHSIGKSMEALYRQRARPGAEGFAAALDAALERGVQRLEDCTRSPAARCWVLVYTLCHLSRPRGSGAAGKAGGREDPGPSRPPPAHRR